MPKLTLPLIIVLLMMVAAMFYQKSVINELTGKVKHVAEQRDNAQKELATANSAIERMQQLTIHRQQQLLAQQQLIDQLQLAAKQQTGKTKEVHNAPENKPWSNTPLPNDIKQLRQRPAITSASDYYQRMRHANAMHPKPSSSSQ